MSYTTEDLVMKELNYMEKQTRYQAIDRQIADLIQERLAVRQELCDLERWFLTNRLDIPE